MAHELHTNAAGIASFAYQTSHGEAWHKLGQALTTGSTIEDWIEASGLSFEVHQANVTFTAPDGTSITVPDRFVNFRNDTNAPLGVVSNRYRLIQPKEVVEFFRDLCHDNGLEMSAAGALRNGERYWATAKVPGIECQPVKGDKIEGFVLFSTSCDGSLASTISNVSTRVVCMNTLRVALAEKGRKTVRTKHSSGFNPEAVKKQLNIDGFCSSWATFADHLKTMVKCKINPAEAEATFAELLRPPTEKPADRQDLKAQGFSDLLSAPVRGGYTPVATNKEAPERAIRGLADVMQSYYSAPGAMPGTAYGALNAVTHYVDHVRGTSADKRMDSAWLGQGADLKDRAFAQLLERSSSIN